MSHLIKIKFIAQGRNIKWVGASLLLVLLGFQESLAGGEGASEMGGATFLWIAVILLAAKISSLVERLGQPPVLGELLAGVILGNTALLGPALFEPIKTDPMIAFLAQLGVVILLFQIGLESNVQEMRRVGRRAFLVAVVGVAAPFILGVYLVGPLLLPDLSLNGRLFLGAALTATSVGITARVFWDLRKLQTPEAQIILGAAVIDDVIGLIILAVVSAIATLGAASWDLIGWITAKAVLFVIGAILFGQILAPLLGRWLSKIHTGLSMKFTLAVSFGLAIASLSQSIGLAPIVGAFAAGLVLEPVHFRFFRDPEIVEDINKVLQEVDPQARKPISKVLERHADRHIRELLEPVGYFLVPIFFVQTGMSVKLETLFDLSLLAVALGVTVVALLGKLVSGLAAGRVRKWIVGWGMVPRGEVGLIFAMMGKSLGVVSDQIFSVIVTMVILTTLLTPPVLTFLLKRYDKTEGA